MWGRRRVNNRNPRRNARRLGSHHHHHHHHHPTQSLPQTHQLIFEQELRAELMCRDCVSGYLHNIVANVKAQLHSGSRSPIYMCFEPCNTCTPIELNPGILIGRRRVFQFPGGTYQDSHTFAVLLRLCGLIAANFDSGKKITVRDLYYQDVALFRTQNIVVCAISRLTKLMLVPRDALNVLPSPNGLVTGDLTIALEGQDMLEVVRSNGPSLIPAQPVSYVAAKRRPAFLLVVENEAVFAYLQSKFPEGVILTGKGFPDRATRRLIKLLTITYPDVPVFGLVDSDPHGILILHNYENGSEQSIEQQEPLNMIFLGVSLLDYSEGLVPLTPHDISVSMSTLRKDWVHEPKYRLCKTELQRGLFMHQKGEMNTIDAKESLTAYVRNKIANFHESCSQLPGSAEQHPRLICHGSLNKTSSALLRAREVSSMHTSRAQPGFKRPHTASDTELTLPNKRARNTSFEASGTADRSAISIGDSTLFSSDFDMAVATQ